MTQLKPRRYQLEAAEWALSRGRAVVCMPTGTGKTVVAGLWIRRLLESGRAKRVLVLEPTRFMVEQASWFLRERMGIDAWPVHGSLPVSYRRLALQRGRVIVATPEIVVADYGEFEEAGFDAVVVDECHHTTGQDAYKKVMTSLDFKYRLGLSAFIPPSRKAEIVSTIGEIRCWGWEHPELAKYIPEWVAEVYEAPFNDAERRAYEYLEDLWARHRGPARSLLSNAMRWMARDGPLALEETLRKPGSRLARIAPLLGALLEHPNVRPLHKLHALVRAVMDHEPVEKAIVFVDRVVVATSIARMLPTLNPVLILGRRRIDPHTALLEARKPETRLVIATSAGEEGIDLPEADLLVVWSPTASPLRFIQRLGRLLRATHQAGKKQKAVVYVTTPDTVDVDSLVDGLMLASKHGVHVNIEEEVLRGLLALSKRRRILDALEEKPMPLDILARALQAPPDRVEAGLRWLLRHGYAVYIYTGIGRVYASSTNIKRLYMEYPDDLAPRPGVEATILAYPAGQRDPLRRIRGGVETARKRLHRLLEKHGAFTRLVFTVLAPHRGLLRMHRYTYSYLVDNKEKLDLAIDNAYSAPAPGASEDITPNTRNPLG